MDNLIIDTYTDEATGLQSFVVVNTYGFGYNVSLKDVDAGEFVPFVEIYKDLATALNRAKAIIKTA